MLTTMQTQIKIPINRSPITRLIQYTTIHISHNFNNYNKNKKIVLNILKKKKKKKEGVFANLLFNRFMVELYFNSSD